MITFEDSILDINKALSKKRAMWTLNAIQWMDFEDVSQIIRIHIHKKWHLWNQARPLPPWLNTIITNQMINLARNIYGTFSRPCLKCAASEDGNLCSIYTTQCSACPLYDKWVKNKKPAHDISLPLALEFHSNELQARPDSNFDLEKAITALHTKLIEPKVLKPNELKVYQLSYVDQISDQEVIKKLGLKNENKTHNMANLKYIENLKLNILKRAKKLLYQEGLDY